VFALLGRGRFPFSYSRKWPWESRFHAHVIVWSSSEPVWWTVRGQSTSPRRCRGDRDWPVQSSSVQPLVYQVATGILAKAKSLPPTRMVLKKQANASVQLGEVTQIDFAYRTVTVQLGERVTVTSLDSLVVAAAAQQTYFGNDHFAEHAPGLKAIDDALELRGRVLNAFAEAEVSKVKSMDLTLTLPRVMTTSSSAT